MRLTRWGRLLLALGVAMVVLSVLPAALFGLLPQAFSEGFSGLVAALLTLTVTPLGVIIAVLGAFLLLLGLLRRD